MNIIYPQYFYIVERIPGGWDFLFPRRVFFSPEGKKINAQYREKQYGLTKQQITIELFRLEAGKLGYYLADMQNRKYYYCGRDRSAVKNQLLKLGIGRFDPLEAS